MATRVFFKPPTSGVYRLASTSRIILPYMGIDIPPGTVDVDIPSTANRIDIFGPVSSVSVSLDNSMTRMVPLAEHPGYMSRLNSTEDSEMEAALLDASRQRTSIKRELSNKIKSPRWYTSPPNRGTVENKLGAWGEWQACPAQCGITASIRTRKIIPPLNRPPNDMYAISTLEEYKDCSKPCFTAEDIEVRWKKITKSVEGIPELFKTEFVDVEGKQLENPFWVNRLIFRTEEQLTTVLQRWTIVPNSPLSLSSNWDVYRGRLAPGSILMAGESVYDRNFLSRLVFTGKSLEFRDSADTLLWSLPTPESTHILATDNGTLVTASGASSLPAGIMSIRNGALVASLNSKATLYVPIDASYMDLESIAPITITFTQKTTIMKADDGSFAWDGKFQIMQGLDIMLEIDAESIRITSSDVEFLKGGSVVRTVKSARNIYMSSTGRLDFTNKAGDMIAVMGKGMISIPPGMNFARGESIGVWSSSGDTQLVWQSDGNLVLYGKENVVLWALNRAVGKMADRMEMRSDSLVLLDGQGVLFTMKHASSCERAAVLVSEDCFYLIDVSKTPITVGAVVPNVESKILQTIAKNLHSKFPNFAICGSLASNTTVCLNNVCETVRPAFQSRILGMDDFISSMNPNRCPPTDILCNVGAYNPSGWVVANNQTIMTGCKWFNTLTAQTTAVSNQGADAFSPPTTHVGYKALWSNSGKLRSEPMIWAWGRTGHVCVKKDIDSFVEDYVASKTFTDAVKASRSMQLEGLAALLRLPSTFTIDPNIALQVSTFTGTLADEMLQSRELAIKETCYQNFDKFKDQCEVYLPRDQFFHQLMSEKTLVENFANPSNHNYFWWLLILVFVLYMLIPFRRIHTMIQSTNKTNSRNEAVDAGDMPPTNPSEA